MIPCVESQYTQEYIANVFWRQYIAKVSNITLIPYIKNSKNSEIYNIAYINIAEWCDSEVAYNFIQRVNNPLKEARIVHKEDNWWVVQINTHNNGNILVGSYTFVFESKHFVNKQNEFLKQEDDLLSWEEHICDDKVACST